MGGADEDALFLEAGPVGGPPTDGVELDVPQSDEVEHRKCDGVGARCHRKRPGETAVVDALRLPDGTDAEPSEVDALLEVLGERARLDAGGARLEPVRRRPFHVGRGPGAKQGAGDGRSRRDARRTQETPPVEPVVVWHGTELAGDPV